MKLATTTADFRSYARTPAEAVKLFEGTGFRVLDLSLYTENYPGSPFVIPGDGWKKEIGEAGEAAAKLGIRFCQAHGPDGEFFVPGEKMEQTILARKRSIEACAMLGIPAIVLHNTGSPELTPKQYLKKNRDVYSQYFDLMEKYGVHVLIENGCEQHGAYFYMRTGADMIEFLEYVNHPLLQACWDTGHAHMRNMDQYESIVTLGKSLRALHIQDNYGDRDSHTAPFFGCCNFDPVLQGLLDIGYAGAFTFEGGSLMRDHDTWPHFRKPWEYRGQSVTTLQDVPLRLKRQAVALIYEIGKYMLEQYGIYEY